MSEKKIDSKTQIEIEMESKIVNDDKKKILIIVKLV